MSLDSQAICKASIIGRKWTGFNIGEKNNTHHVVLALRHIYIAYKWKLNCVKVWKLTCSSTQTVANDLENCMLSAKTHF